MSLNTQLVRSVYPQIDWDQYDREVVAESEVTAALRSLWDACVNGGDPVTQHDALVQADAVLRRLRGEVTA